MKNFIRRFRRSAITFPLAVITAQSLMAISESSYRSSVDSLDRLGHLAVARINNLVLIRQVLDAENGQRGYLITGRSEYLEPYRKTMDNIGQTMRTLQDFYAKEPQQVTDFTVLAGLVNKKLSEMDTTIQLRSEGREDAWRAVIETDIGREQMEAIRVASERLFKRETDQITASRASVYQTLQLSRLGVAAMTALSVLAFFMYLRQTATLDQERRRQQLALQVERDLLEHQVKGRTAQLTELAHHLQTAREDERNRLARDIHPGARIGKRFFLDHGFSVIGDARAMLGVEGNERLSVRGEEPCDVIGCHGVDGSGSLPSGHDLRDPVLHFHPEALHGEDLRGIRG